MRGVYVTKCKCLLVWTGTGYYDFHNLCVLGKHIGKKGLKRGFAERPREVLDGRCYGCSYLSGCLYEVRADKENVGPEMD